MAKKRKKLGEILIEWNIVKPEALTEALQYGMEHGKRIGEALDGVGVERPPGRLAG